ncbi:uncharacterized protein LOC105394246 isoform X3 [Plutella xylostella]|uniref:uncharacterized protein LOC105394246 isoform X3 n=1 Tax=Plutella xylostella TaxID=51655 RepID=UPI002032D7D7|nr:uncharacterized protein LOC105394246 isoform X3 [Plutella xylostella]
MGETEEFNPLVFEKKLAQLKDTQESIQGLSSWCLKQREHHKKIVQSWLNVLKRVKIEQRLVLFYLANDVIQYSKRKNYEFVESWGLNLQKATPLVRDEKVRPKILRIFKIWEQRSVYDDEFLSDLTGLLSAGAIKKTDDDPLDFQPQQLVNKIKQCTVLEADTDLRLKYIHENPLQLSDADELCASLKERSNKDDVEKELNEGIACVERYTQALQREIVAREALLALLTSANQYYSTQRGEVKVVAYAYKNFGARVRALKRKLDELIPTLESAPSPPRRDEEVPSPAPDDDLMLPQDIGHDIDTYDIDKTFNTSLGGGSLYNLGLSSFLGSESALAMFHDDADAANKIEVISTRPADKQDFDVSNFLKTLTPTEVITVSDNVSVASGTLSQKSQDTLPGLDLLTPESTGNAPPPISFYGSTLEPEEPEPYRPEPAPWSNNVSPWTIPAPLPVPVPPPALAPPPAPPAPPALAHAVPPASPPSYTQDRITGDVDHRGILPPPPPPPVIPTLSVLGQLEDVDHRLLPSLPPPPPAPAPLSRHPSSNQDVDHRNLISLTHQPQPVPSVEKSRGVDQDYRVPPPVPPPDIVESVDMDLSEDEEHPQRHYPHSEPHRRNSFNQNNKVLVGGDNGKTNHANLIRINSMPAGDHAYQDKLAMPSTAPVMPLSNPFDNMPKFNNMPEFAFREDPRLREEEEMSNDSAYDEDIRSRMRDNSIPDLRNPSPPKDYDDEWHGQSESPRFMNPRFPRNWSPGVRNFRPQGFGPQQQFWPRNGPRPPPRNWGPRPQRFNNNW